mmetsp:Transcript_15313/g.33303  ORF Transcript_15313/g.33303 Transcript_15313/m.33303 type:complete len:113 (-) Transcript_15313:327-665(-)
MAWMGPDPAWRGGYLRSHDENFILDQDVLFNNTRLSQMSSLVPIGIVRGAGGAGGGDNKELGSFDWTDVDDGFNPFGVPLNGSFFSSLRLKISPFTSVLRRAQSHRRSTHSS